MYFYKFESKDYEELQWRVLVHKEKFDEEQIKEMMIEATVWVLENDRTDGWYWEIPDGSIGQLPHIKVTGLAQPRREQ